MKKPSKYHRERMKLKNRPRKILNAEERVLVILMYDENPVYQQVASVFKCSWEQIKNVVINSEAILQFYINSQTWKPEDNPKVKRMKKIYFLGSAMYEFVKRSYYHKKLRITDDIIRQKATEFRDVLHIVNFFPNTTWVNDLKHNYSINLSNLNWLVIPKTPSSSLECNDIIDYCRKMVDRAYVKHKQIENTAVNKIGKTTILNRLRDNYSMNDTIYEDEPDEAMVENEEGEIMCFDDYDEDTINDNEEGQTIDFGNGYDENFEMSSNENTNEITAQSTPLPNNSGLSVPMPKIIKMEPKSRPSSPTESRTNISISGYAEALKHLQPLEDFAMEVGDFRAINLLSTLGDIYDKALQRRKNK